MTDASEARIRGVSMVCFDRGARAMQDAILLELNTIDTEGLSANDVRREVYKMVSRLGCSDAHACVAEVLHD